VKCDFTGVIGKKWYIRKFWEEKYKNILKTNFWYYLIFFCVFSFITKVYLCALLWHLLFFIFFLTKVYFSSTWGRTKPNTELKKTKWVKIGEEEIEKLNHIDKLYIKLEFTFDNKFFVMNNYMLLCQKVFLKLQQKILLKDTLKEKMENLQKMLFIKIFCYLNIKIRYCLIYIRVTHKYKIC